MSEWLFLETRRGSLTQPGNEMLTSRSIKRKCMDIPRWPCAKELAEYGGFTLHKAFVSFSHENISFHPTITQQGRTAAQITWFGWYPRHSPLEAATFRSRDANEAWCCEIHGPVSHVDCLCKSLFTTISFQLMQIKVNLSQKPNRKEVD